MGKLKTANGAVKQTKAIVGKGPSKRPAPVAKIATAAGRKAGEKGGKEGKAGAEGQAGLPKRKLGLRGAAPWAARHAAKHAAEARARAAEPPPPGSARATIRVPTGAEELKAKIGELHNALVQIRFVPQAPQQGLLRYRGILRDVQQHKLYEAKGYGSFEAFLEREIDLGKTTRSSSSKFRRSSSRARRSSTAWTRSLRPCRCSMLRPTRRARAVLRPLRPRRRRTRGSRFR